MLTIEELRAKVCEAIDQRAEQIIGIATHILRNPESGFREEGTARFVQQQMDALGLPHRDSLALTGVRGRFDGGIPGPSVAVIGELDSMVVPAHPYANPVSGAIRIPSEQSCGSSRKARRRQDPLIRRQPLNYSLACNLAGAQTVA